MPLAPAMGNGSLAVPGCKGLEILKRLPHVPELSNTLFSVWAAMSEGMSVYFVPTHRPDGKDHVTI